MGFSGSDLGRRALRGSASERSFSVKAELKIHIQHGLIGLTSGSSDSGSARLGLLSQAHSGLNNRPYVWMMNIVKLPEDLDLIENLFIQKSFKEDH